MIIIVYYKVIGGVIDMRFSKMILPAFLVTLALLCGISVHTLYEIRDYSTLINYVGIVRGGTQRLIKLELLNQPNDELKEYLDDVLVELDTGEGKYNLILVEDRTYRDNLDKLKMSWNDILEDIQIVRQGGSKEQLISDSEKHFEIANNTVFAAEHFSTDQSNQLLMMLMILSGIALLTWGGIIVFHLRSMVTLQRSNSRLSLVAYRDNLTGANNRQKFVIDASSLIRYSKEGYAFIFVDIEHFKYINDVFGYQFGDQVLKTYSNIISRSLNKGETFARNNADSFIILRKYENKEELERRQKDIDDQLIEYVKTTQDNYTIRLCGGICCHEDVIEELTVDGYLDRAVFAQDTIKKDSQVNYAFYSESIRNKLYLEKKIESNIQTALDNHEFIFYVQPKVDIQTNKIACGEALVRWQSSEGMIYPDLFIPIFEKNRRIKELDTYIYREVCKWIRGRLDNNLPCLPISVNVSKIQFYNPGFINEYCRIKEEFDIPDGMIEIEFTESVAFERTDLLIEIIQELKLHGFSCSMDDFGKAYSSLNLLKDLPIDVLKIDSAFFEETNNPEKVMIIIEDIVNMVKHLGIETVAEGVERDYQVEFLREIGCDLVQGYVFYRPMPVGEFEKLIEEG